MSSKWSPDDSLMQPGGRGTLRGTQAIIDALRKHGVRYGNSVITSRDKGIAAAQRDLKRTGMPPGVEQWQIPIVYRPTGDVLSFLGRMKPRARVPAHSHEFGVERVVLKGDLRFGRKTLKVGDWMFVPAGVVYAVSAGPQGCTIMYRHGPCPWPPW